VDEISVSDELVIAIRFGDVAAVERLVTAHPDLAAAAVGGRHGTRTPLHVVTDWPGYFPNGPQIARVLLDAGADANARDPEPQSETPLQWAASSDDVDVARVLIDGGADINIPDGSIGSPLENAIGYGCWNVAHLLAARGARIDSLWVAAALGALDRLEELLASPLGADGDLVSQAFWHACAAAHRRAAERLLAHGADPNWTPDYADGTALDSAQGRGTQRENVITWLRELGVPETST
jgi:hypothetical protein